MCLKHVFLWRFFCCIPLNFPSNWQTTLATLPQLTENWISTPCYQVAFPPFVITSKVSFIYTYLYCDNLTNQKSLKSTEIKSETGQGRYCSDCPRSNGNREEAVFDKVEVADPQSEKESCVAMQCNHLRHPACVCVCVCAVERKCSCVLLGSAHISV